MRKDTRGLLLFAVLFLPLVSLVNTSVIAASWPVTDTRPVSQAMGNAGTVQGTIVDSSGAVIAGANASLENKNTNYSKSMTTDETGSFKFTNVPPNDYQLIVTAEGFAPASQQVSVRSAVPSDIGKIALTPAAAGATITVNGGVSVEDIPTAHTDIGTTQIEKLPINTPGSGLNDVVALSAPSVVPDSNGFFHPLGDHGGTSFVVDDQAISDQRSKAFSTQIPPDAVQQLEVITGAVPAEYGDKDSMVVNTTTKSGLGLKSPSGTFNTSYGTYGSEHEDGTFGFGGANAGNFTAFDFERAGRFLDSPEFTPLHDHGDSSSLFDRVDYTPSSQDAFHLNVFLSRNAFQIPNQFDQQALGQDQHQLVRGADVAAGWVHTFNPSTLLTLSPYYRLDQVWYYPSANPFSDQTQTIGQQRRITNAGMRADLAYSKGVHNAKFGVQVSHTFLTEAFQLGITDPNFNNPSNPNFLPGLLPFDLTRGGHIFTFNGHTDIKQEAFYGQDALTLRQLTLTLGLRFDNYDGLVHDDLIQPRIGASYLIKRTNTVLRGSYTRNFESPYNENLIFSSSTGGGGLAAAGVLDRSTSNDPLKAGHRNQFNAGIQQGFGRYVVFDGDYFWKYTNNAADFNAILNTPITFPISWSKSKIDGVGLRLTVANYKGLSVYFTAGHTRARFFPPETGGLFFNSALPTGVFRIDHDQAFEQTTTAVYEFDQIKKLAPYISVTWAYDSGEVAGSVPDFATALALTPDQQAQMGLFCGSTIATPTQGITDCTSAVRGATRVVIPAPGTENDDHNPARIAPRHLFDASIGTDNLLRTERVKLTLRLSGENLANKEALYNFLSTFSGTHFVSPRTFSAQLGLRF